MSLHSPATEPAETILASLNPAQCRAVTSKASTVAILAGPGSGKTHTLTSRVVWLVDHIGYQPADVIVATFTVKAAREMKDRIGRALGEERSKRIVLGTFHSIARRYLAAYGKHIGLSDKFGIADDGDSRSIIQRICKRLQLSIDPAGARSWISKKKAKGTEQHTPKRQPNGKEMPENADLLTCYREYQDHLERSNLLDYDDLLTKCVSLLQKRPACVSNVQTVLIDEYQDTNGVQYELMKLLAQARERITVVGDPDQSIYGWRSAEVKNLFRLLRDFPGTDEISLEENYRSSQAILDVSLKVIQQDTRRYQKVLLPTHKKGTRPVLRRLRTAAAEAEWIVSEIRRAILMSGEMMTHNDMAILLRSAALSRHIEAALGRAGVAYKMVGGFKFYDRAEVRVLIDYLRVVNQPDNNDAIARVINVPRRGIGDATVKSLLEEAEVAKMSVWTVLTKHCRGDRAAKTNIKKAMEQKISGELIKLITTIRKKIDEPPTGSSSYHLVDLIHNLVSQVNFQKYLKDTYPEDHENRWANVQEFINLAGDFMKDLDATADDDRLPEVDGLQQVVETDALGLFLSNVALASDAQKGEVNNKPVVTISTIHAAKGLEWPVVFVPAVYNGSIPHARSEDLDEERRLLYVAMTRAKSLLYLSCPQQSSQAGGGGGEQTELSRFLPSEVHPYFAKRGPAFNSEVIAEIGRILGRDDIVPTAAKVFSSMPLGERLEDNLFPVDPDETSEASRQGRNGQWNRRPRGPLPKEDASVDTGALSSVRTMTTMDTSSNFTMASLPGFTTANAHQSVLLAAAKEVAAIAEKGPAGPADARKVGKTKRSADQPSVHGFFAKRQKSDPSDLVARDAAPQARPPARHTSMTAGMRPQPTAVPEPVLPSIAPDLSNHRVNTNKFARPGPKLGPGREDPRKAYPNFSSSPPRDKGDATEVEGEADDEIVKGPRERPANCLHVTTATAPHKFGGFTRPGMIKKEGGIAPIDRLRKPFKPLTIQKGGR